MRVIKIPMPAVIDKTPIWNFSKCFLALKFFLNKNFIKKKLAKIIAKINKIFVKKIKFVASKIKNKTSDHNMKQ